MTIETIKRMLDACYQGKRIRDMLPPLPKGVTSSYIQYLDVIQSLERNGVHVKISDISDALNLPRPGVTRTVKEMEDKGYLKKNRIGAGWPRDLPFYYGKRPPAFAGAQHRVLCAAGAACG